jgi:hypothetical protein
VELTPVDIGEIGICYPPENIPDEPCDCGRIDCWYCGCDEILFGSAYGDYSIDPIF